MSISPRKRAGSYKPPPQTRQNNIVDKELSDIQNTTKILNKEILTKIQEYKSSNNHHLEKFKKIANVKETCQNQISNIKESLSKVLEETRYTTDELKEMREKIEENVRDSEAQHTKKISAPLQGQLFELKKEIDSMNDRFEYNEEELRTMTLENYKLKDIITQLKDFRIEKKSVDTRCTCTII